MTSAKQIQRRRLEEKLTRECGALIMEALRDPRVIEIMLNPDGRLWLDVAGEGLRHMVGNAGIWAVKRRHQSHG